MNQRSGLHIFSRLADKYFTYPLVPPEQHQESFLSHENTLEPVLLDEAMEEITAAKREMEAAVDRILTVAEKLMTRERGAGDTNDASLEADCFAIFEACAFQDITGQRLSKALKKIDQASAIHEVQSRHQTLWAKPRPGTGEPTSYEEGLLNGPALPGSGLDQAAVNLLLKSGEGK